MFYFSSYTGDRSASFTETLHEKIKIKEFEIPPTPPPRHKGHARASSLDLNKILNTKSLQPTAGRCISVYPSSINKNSKSTFLAV